MSMFCYQCEQAARGTGCTAFGVCGKDPETAALQDLLLHGLKGLSLYAHNARALGATDDEIDLFTTEVLFTTVTNVNFDPERLRALLKRLVELRAHAKALYFGAFQAVHGRRPGPLGGAADWQPESTAAGLAAQAAEVGVAAARARFGEDLAGLAEMVVYGLKGTASYADHAHVLGRNDPSIPAFFQEALAFLAQGDYSAESLTALALRVGEVNLRVMALLDSAHTDTFGHPSPTKVRVTPVEGKAILVSGHDLRDLQLLLEQTADMGVNIYTHGEMLPAHGYPELRKYPHLVGNYGGAWQDQAREFDAFPGAILMTTNCIQKPRDTYRDRIFTTGLVAWPGLAHIGPGKDFTPVINAALADPGFTATEEEKTITVGFGHDAVLGVAPVVIDAVKSGAIRHFFLVGGCDGAKSGRNYYTELAEKIPDDCVILTLACGKYRFNKMGFGEIGGIPRLLDVGQCNDAYSAIRIAVALSEAFGVGVNELPLSLVLSWYEQKAVCILLTLLHLGIKGIRLGPSLPAFVTPAVLDVLVNAFDLKPITTPDEDLAAILG